MADVRPDDCKCGHPLAAHDAGECWTYPDATDYPDPPCECWGYEHIGETEENKPHE